MKKSAVRGQKLSKQQKQSLSTIRFDRESENASSNDDRRSKYPTQETLPQTEFQQHVHKQTIQMFGSRITFEEMEYFPNYNYVLPAQQDGYNCGVYVGLYMTMLARNIINYRWPLEIDEYRWRLAVAFERNDPEIFLESQHQP